MMGWGLSSSMEKALSLGSKDRPGIVAKAKSSGAKSILYDKQRPD
jgi:hypothetical protein